MYKYFVVFIFLLLTSGQSIACGGLTEEEERLNCEALAYATHQHLTYDDVALFLIPARPTLSESIRQRPWFFSFAGSILSATSSLPMMVLSRSIESDGLITFSIVWGGGSAVWMLYSLYKGQTTEQI
ncbi:MAG: hypothetical protein ACPGXY_06575 [Alphaproteobacteria bacterium]